LFYAEESPMTTCSTCELIARRDAGTAPDWDRIQRTQYWDVAHCYETSIPGWLVLVARRHIQSLDELTKAEAVEMGLLLRNISSALKSATGCLKTYVLQFAESPQHPHVHFHIIPRMPDLPVKQRSVRIFACLGVAEEERVSQAEMNALALQLREKLLAEQDQRSSEGESYEIQI
jgi:diadenosine tetraphosphate (Ap4A) HIT family hydrolase